SPLLFFQKLVVIWDVIAKGLGGSYEALQGGRLHVARLNMLLIDNDRAKKRPASAVRIFDEVAKVVVDGITHLFPLQAAFFSQLLIRKKRLVLGILPNELE